jgi:hypothetical protein
VFIYGCICPKHLVHHQALCTQHSFPIAVLLHLISSAIFLFTMLLTPKLPVNTVARTQADQTGIWWIEQMLKQLDSSLECWCHIFNLCFSTILFGAVSQLVLHKIIILSLSLMLIVLLTGSGGGKGKAWGCDLSYKYVEINAEYTTWYLYSPWRKMP